MARLTEEMVIARSRQSDLSSIKKLNCWGAELGDVSVLRRMPNVEVLALSINKITTLSDFAHCPRLRELYVRKNCIRELAEIRYLQGLSRLTSLWLDENPCTDCPNYRMTVLRNLPNLQKLDNIAVQPDELQEAMRKGTAITDPEEEYYNQQEAYSQYRSQRSTDSSPERLTERADPPDYRRGGDQGSDCSEGASEVVYSEPITNGCRKSPPTSQVSPRRRSYSPEIEEPRYEHPAARGQYYDRSPTCNEEDATNRGSLRHTNSSDEATTEKLPTGIRHSQSAQSVKEYVPTNGDSRSYHQASPQLGSRHSADLSHSQSAYQDPYYERGERQESYQQVPQTRCPVEQYERESVRERETFTRRERDGEIASAVMVEHKGFTRRPVTRNSNLLSAVLCLVKELDYPSLEVAEMAVRCRMDELANHQ